MRSFKVLLVSASLLLPVSAYADEVDIDRMLQEMEAQLQISQERFEAMRPKLRSALEEKSKELSRTFDSALEQGLIELEQMGNRYSQATSEAADRLDELMRSDEVNKLRTYLSELDEDAIREARDQMVEEFIEVLQLTADQIEAMKPIIREKLEILGEILERYVNAGKSGYEQFRSEFEAETRRGIKEVESILNPEQVEVFEEQLESIGSAIQADVFEI